MSILIENEDGTITDDTYVTSIDSIMILKELMSDDKIFDENREWTEYGRNRVKELREKWCLENQKDNYNN
jgi:glycine cleavage system aminomethyltransferase T|tara:strand:- start:60 stop:269 length:210 start_codon:yes stop_codon:yes gene_type:complete